MIKYLIITILVICSFFENCFSQIACQDFTITGSTTSPSYSVSQGAGCTLSPTPIGALIWTGFSTTGFITYTFATPQTNVSIWYTAVNNNDFATMSVNGGGVLSLSMVNGCAGLSGNVVGPYIGTGLYGDFEVNVTSTLPFTVITLVNTAGGSGFVSGDCNSVTIVNTPVCNTQLGNDTTLCIGDALTLDATANNATYLWQDNSTNSTLTVSQQGTYWVQVTQNNCTTSDTINVNFNPAPVVNLGNDTTFCVGDALTLDATTNNATYLWQDNSTNSTFTAAQQGTYWVQVTQNNCTITDSINVNFNPLPIVSFGNDTSLCIGDALTLDATNNNATYLWQDSSTNSTFNVAQQGIYWVQVMQNNCTKFDTINVDFNPLPVVNLNNDTTLCIGASLTLDATTNNATYLWQDNSTNSTFNVAQQGIYWVQVTQNNCSSSDTINVNFNPLPVINLGNDTTLCIGDALTLNATNNNATYLWQDNATNSTFNVAQQGIYWVQVTQNNCTTSDTINVNFNPLPIVNFGNDTSLCVGDALTLDATNNNATYLWHNNSTNSTFNVAQQGTYWVQVTQNNCTSSDTINVNFNSPPVVNLGNDTTLCAGEPLTLDASTNNATYLWQNNSINSTFNVFQQGTYWVQVKQNNCTSSDTINVNFNPLPIVNLGNDTTLCPGDALILGSTTNNATYTYLWQDNSTNSTFNVAQQGTYWLQVTQNNCILTDTIIISEEVCEIILEMPNVFTPNNDGVNDLLVPVLSKGVISMSTMIYNRWGNKIFETNNLLIEWDGQSVMNGTYFWIINYSDIKGNQWSKKGLLTLFK